MPDDIVDSLITALLGVNGYGLDKVWNLLPRFRQEGLTKASQVASEDINRLTVRLINAGYARGRLTETFAQRVQHLMAAIASGSLDELCDPAVRKDVKVIQRMLCGIRGIGPHVARNAWMLLQEEGDK
jgi:hypothetical protein